jgi:hypothetical protein
MQSEGEKPLCAQCGKPAGYANGGTLTSQYPPIEVFVHDSCKEEWLQANGGGSFQKIKPTHEE